MTAEEVRQLASGVSDTLDKVQYDKTIALVAEAAVNGEYRLVLDYRLRETNINRLTEDGFEVFADEDAPHEVHWLN